MTGAVGAVLFSIIAPNSVRAKHRVSSDQICRMNLQRLDAELYEYKQDHGRFPETLTPIYAKSNSQIDGCLEVMPDPFSASTRTGMEQIPTRQDTSVDRCTFGPVRSRAPTKPRDWTLWVSTTEFPPSQG